MYVLCASIAGSHAHCKFIIYTSLCASFNTLMIVLAWFCRANATADVIPLYRGRKLSGKVRACNLHAMIWRMLYEPALRVTVTCMAGAGNHCIFMPPAHVACNFARSQLNVCIYIYIYKGIYVGIYFMTCRTET